MPKYHLLAFILAAFYLIPSLGTAAEQSPVERADTRILIDISGSMKKNDPTNLRRPALRMLVGLLPADSRAGVWTFGQYVNMQVPLGKIDKYWKARARKGAGKIHSRGLFTNIEEALRRSIADWEGPTADYRRHLILLTDGMVDVSKNPAQSTASRQRILHELIPRLQEYGAKVHTIALSERADHELMKTLSDKTGGWYEQVDEAVQLQRVFLRLFEKVGRPDSVPLKENLFVIDKSISEATLLIFRSHDSAPTQVTTPSGKHYSAKNLPDNIKWHRDEGYDMLTITAPEVGEWRIDAALDPDNRVMVVTDLKMHSTELPNKLVLGEQIPFVVSFSDQGKTITERSFLDVLNVQVEQKTPDGPGEPRPLYDDGRNGDPEGGDGSYSLVIGEDPQQGRVELLLSVEGKTFQREQRQTYELVPCCRLEASDDPAAGEAMTRLRVVVDPELVDPAAVNIRASLKGEAEAQQPVMLLPAASAGEWETLIDRNSLAGSWILATHLSAKTRAGNTLELDLDAVTLEGAAEPPPPVEAVAEPAPLEKAAEPETDWMMLVSLFAAANLVLLIIIGALVWWIRRRAQGDSVQLIDDGEAQSGGAGE